MGTPPGDIVVKIHQVPDPCAPARSSWRCTLRNTILIVDDAEFMRVMLRDICTDMNLEVVGEAADGEQAVAMHGELSPDLILLDITMPKLDGTEALKQILSQDPTAQVVMITALGQKEQVLAAIKSGARDFIIKPFDQERVTETLSRIMAPQPVA